MKLICTVLSLTFVLLALAVQGQESQEERLAAIMGDVQRVVDEHWLVQFSVQSDSLVISSKDTFKGVHTGLNSDIAPAEIHLVLYLTCTDYLAPEKYVEQRQTLEKLAQTEFTQMKTKVPMTKEKARVSIWEPVTLEQWTLFFQYWKTSKLLREMPTHFRNGCAFRLETSMLVDPIKRNDPKFAQRMKTLEDVLRLFRRYDGAKTSGLPQKEESK